MVHAGEVHKGDDLAVAVVHLSIAVKGLREVLQRRPFEQLGLVCARRRRVEPPDVGDEARCRVGDADVRRFGALRRSQTTDGRRFVGRA